jgi:heme oxygenase (biliverdin-IX-beta and delta-forming)
MSGRIMSELRDATAREHQELEDEVAISESLKSEETYRSLLEEFYGFVAPLEARMAAFPWAEAGIDFEVRRKAHLLEADLIQLGGTPSAVPKCEALPVLENFAEACGALYVMEGSTLGGQHILRMARQANLPESAAKYFRSYGEKVGEMWKSLGA